MIEITLTNPSSRFPPFSSLCSFFAIVLDVALPTGDYDKTKALLFCPDVFGLGIKNNKLLADDFARNGFGMCPHQSPFPPSPLLSY